MDTAKVDYWPSDSELCLLPCLLSDFLSSQQATPNLVCRGLVRKRPAELVRSVMKLILFLGSLQVDARA